VIVHTSDIRGAGTDATVFCSIIGAQGKTRQVKLDNSKNNFEKGATDIFTFQDADCGKIEKLIIGHDGSGLGAAW
jgi:lipoxygenase homology domain-containing protein 1